MKKYRYEADTAFSKTLAADYQHRRLPPQSNQAYIIYSFLKYIQ